MRDHLRSRSNDPPCIVGGVPITPLLTEAVQVNSQIAYAKAIFRALRDIQELGLGPTIHDAASFDVALAVVVSHWHSDESSYRQMAEDLQAGVLWIRSDLKGKLHFLHRSVQAWDRVDPGRCRVGVPERCAAAAIARGLQHPQESPRYQAAVIAAVSMDGYLRTQDWIRLRVADVFPVVGEEGLRYGLHLGVSSRGEARKTSRDDRIVLDEIWVNDLLASYVPGLAPVEEGRSGDVAAGGVLAPRPAQEKVFSLTYAEFLSHWKQMTRECHFESVCHELRHSGAANDAWMARRPLAGPVSIQRRGCWASEKSVRRYTNVAALAERQAQMQSAHPDILAEGDRFLSRMRQASGGRKVLYVEKERRVSFAEEGASARRVSARE